MTLSMNGIKINLKINSIVFNRVFFRIRLFVWDSDHPGKCWDSSSETAYDVGKHQLKNGCGEISCSEAFTLQTKTSVYKQPTTVLAYELWIKRELHFVLFCRCGTVGAPPGFKNVHDLTKPYPSKDCLRLLQIVYTVVHMKNEVYQFFIFELFFFQVVAWILLKTMNETKRDAESVRVR